MSMGLRLAVLRATGAPLKQEAFQCIPRSVNLCRQVIRFNETRAAETKLHMLFVVCICGLIDV